MAYRAFQGASGWYVAFERADGFHRHPIDPRWLPRLEAFLEAARLNHELEREREAEEADAD